MNKVGIIMGSKSDLPIMQEAIDILKEFGIENEVDIVSAHRTPEKLFDYGKNAHARGFAVIIAGAGGAAHLPGMIASLSPLPVIGVPIKSSHSIDGWDSVLSILQMPG
ncbi:MAG: AIR carboxylase family protein, partial [Aquaticitalea sp.]